MMTPHYIAIKEWLIEEIEASNINTPIESERAIAELFHVSRMTARNAINELVDEGYLYRNGNKGTFVSDRKFVKKNTALLKKSDDILDFTIIYFNVKEASEQIANVLGIKKLDLILHVIRLNKKVNHPQNVEEIYLIRKNLNDQDLMNIPKLLDLDQYMNVGVVTQRLVPMIVPVQYVSLLKLKMDTPIIKVESTICSRSGKVMAFIEAYNNPDEMPIEITQ